MTTTLRILGIDPGSRQTGYGVVDFRGDNAEFIASGTIRTVDGGFADRLRQIYESVGDIAAEFEPGIVAIESVFMHKNASSALKLGQARSAAMCATFACGAPLYEYAPREVKLAVVGTGAASKEQVQHMVVALLRLDGTPAPDAADALAVALCHGHHRQVDARLGTGNIIAGAR